MEYSHKETPRHNGIPASSVLHAKILHDGNRRAGRRTRKTKYLPRVGSLIPRRVDPELSFYEKVSVSNDITQFNDSEMTYNMLAIPFFM